MNSSLTNLAQQRTSKKQDEVHRKSDEFLKLFSKIEQIFSEANAVESFRQWQKVKEKCEIQASKVEHMDYLYGVEISKWLTENTTLIRRNPPEIMQKLINDRHLALKKEKESLQKLESDARFALRMAETASQKNKNAPFIYRESKYVEAISVVGAIGAALVFLSQYYNSVLFMILMIIPALIVSFLCYWIFRYFSIVVDYLAQKIQNFRKKWLKQTILDEKVITTGRELDRVKIYISPKIEEQIDELDWQYKLAVNGLERLRQINEMNRGTK